MNRQRRFLIDRVVSRLGITLDTTWMPRPVRVTDGIWVVERRLRTGGMLFPVRSTMVRLSGGGLFVHSPPPPDAAVNETIEAAGGVAAIVVPNPFHHSYAPEYVRACPRATLYIAPGTAERVPRLAAGTLLSDTSPDAWRGEMTQVLAGPTRGMCEVAFLHHASRTLILTDTLMNFGTRPGGWQGFYRRLLGYPTGPGVSRSMRLSLFSDPVVPRRFAATVLALDFDRVVMCHGAIIETGGRDAFRAAYARHGYCDGPV